MKNIAKLLECIILLSLLVIGYTTRSTEREIYLEEGSIIYINYILNSSGVNGELPRICSICQFTVNLERFDPTHYYAVCEEILPGDFSRMLTGPDSAWVKGGKDDFLYSLTILGQHIGGVGVRPAREIFYLDSGKMKWDIEMVKIKVLERENKKIIFIEVKVS